jgi:hypothetical protein
MSDRPEVTEVAAVVASLASAGASGDALGVGGGILEVVQIAKRFFRERQGRIVLRLLDEAYGATSSDPGAFAEFRALFTSGGLKSEHAQAVFIQSVRAAESAVDDAVLPVLAMLLREYQRAGMMDWYFRSACRVFQDLSADELAELRARVCSLTEAIAGEGGVVHGVLVTAGREVRVDAEMESEAPGFAKMYHSVRADFPPPTDATRRVLHLLTANGFGTLTPGEQGLRWQVDVELLKRLRQLLAPA